MRKSQPAVRATIRCVCARARVRAQQTVYGPACDYHHPNTAQLSDRHLAAPSSNK